MAPGSFSSRHQTFNTHRPSLISRCVNQLVSVASVSTAQTKRASVRQATRRRRVVQIWATGFRLHEAPELKQSEKPAHRQSQPLCPSSLLSSFPLSPLCPPPPPALIGQGGESGTGASSYEQSFGRGLGPQADPRPLYRDLCAGHRQHAAQPGVSGAGAGVHAGLPALGPRCDHLPPRGGGTAASSSPPSPWGDPRQDATPIPGPWQHHVAPTPPTQHHQPQRHHAVQTQGPQRGALPAEPWQDAHANVLPGSLRRTHTRSHWGHPQYIHIVIEGGVGGGRGQTVSTMIRSLDSGPGPGVSWVRICRDELL